MPTSVFFGRRGGLAASSGSTTSAPAACGSSSPCAGFVSGAPATFDGDGLADVVLGSGERGAATYVVYGRRHEGARSTRAISAAAASRSAG